MISGAIRNDQMRIRSEKENEKRKYSDACADMPHREQKQKYSHARGRLPISSGVITTFLWMRNIQINTSPNKKQKNKLTGGIGNYANSVMVLVCNSRLRHLHTVRSERNEGFARENIVNRAPPDRDNTTHTIFKIILPLPWKRC